VLERQVLGEQLEIAKLGRAEQWLPPWFRPHQPLDGKVESICFASSFKGGMARPTSVHALLEQDIRCDSGAVALNRFGEPARILQHFGVLLNLLPYSRFEMLP